MNQQTFSAGATPRLALSRINADLTICVWDEPTLAVTTDAALAECTQIDDTLVIAGCERPLTLHVPAACTVTVADVRGNMRGEGITAIEIEEVSGDLALIGCASAKVGAVGGDLTTDAITTTLQVARVGGDAGIGAASTGAIVVGSVSGDLLLNTAAHLRAGDIGGDCSIAQIADGFELSTVGGDLHVTSVAGRAQIARVGGDAVLHDLHAATEIGAIGGDLQLQAAFTPDTVTRMFVGGDAQIMLPAKPNLRLIATVGGEVRGTTVNTSDGGSRIVQTYGDGAALLELQVGGDMALHGDSAPHSSSSSSSAGFARDMEQFARDMEALGRELGLMGQAIAAEITRELSRTFGAAGNTAGSRVADDVARKVEQKLRRAHERYTRRARRARAHGAAQHDDRNWQFDPERLERIKAQARGAAAEGVVGAIDVIERALKNMGLVPPPTPGTPTPPPPAAPGAPSPPPATGMTIRIDQGDTTATTGAATATAAPRDQASLDREREIILRMVADGQISPADGDLLLEALER